MPEKVGAQKEIVEALERIQCLVDEDDYLEAIEEAWRIQVVLLDVYKAMLKVKTRQRLKGDDIDS